MGARLWELYPELIGSEVELNIRRAMEDRLPAEFEQFFPALGNETWFQFYVYPQPGEGIILYCRNTTEARKAEQALRRSEQLAAAGRLAASIAHEMTIHWRLSPTCYSWPKATKAFRQARRTCSRLPTRSCSDSRTSLRGA